RRAGQRRRRGHARAPRPHGPLREPPLRRRRPGGHDRAAPRLPRRGRGRGLRAGAHRSGRHPARRRGGRRTRECARAAERAFRRRARLRRHSARLHGERAGASRLCGARRRSGGAARGRHVSLRGRRALERALGRDARFLNRFEFFAGGENASVKVVRRRTPRERPTQVRQVVEEGATPPPEPPVGPWADRDLWPWLLLLLALVVGGVIAAVLLTRDDGKKAAATTVVSSPPTTVTVARATSTAAAAPAAKTPARAARVELANVLGIPAATAVKRLREDGLQPVVRSVFSTKPRGVVTAQTPGAGTRVAKGSSVTLDVSKGQPAKPVPDVVGQSESQAVSLLRSAGFEATTRRVPSDQPGGTIVAQKPRAGEKA